MASIELRAIPEGATAEDINCGYQYRIGSEISEAVCCTLKWAMAVANPPDDASLLLESTKRQAGVPTACIFGSMGRHCYGEMD